MKVRVADLEGRSAIKAFGPFETADEAAEHVNALALGADATFWTVVPLRAGITPEQP